jgi:hypothetical protein
MKKTLTVTTLALLAGAVSAYSQGQVTMLDYGGGFCIQVFAPQGGNVPVSYGGVSGNEYMGNSGNTYTTGPGAHTYVANSTAGTGYDVQLLLGAGAGDALSTLSTAGPVITQWYLPAGSPIGGSATPIPLSGMWNNAANVVAGAYSANITVAIAAWNNEGNTINTLAAALAADASSIVVPIGFSLAVSDVNGTSSGPADLPTGIESFSLMQSTVPEPSTIALGVMGASALLFRRRK